MIFDAKIVRIAQNHENSTAFSAIYLVLIVKIVFRIVVFFSQRSATKSVRKSKKELRRSSGLRGAGKSTPRDPGGRKRWPGSANPCPPTASPDGVLRTAATNEQKNRTHLYTAKTKRRGLRRGATAGKGPRRGAASVQRDGNTAAAAWRWRGT